MRCPKNECMIRGRCSYPTACVGSMRPTKQWTGPRPNEIDAVGTLKRPVPPERWPYGLPEAHEDCCNLHGGRLYCDCAASDASSEEP